MGKYEKLAENIVREIGGKENVNSLTNCITRLRFKLKDESKANTEVLKNMDGVVTVMQSGGQYQVVIGNHVPDVKKEVDAVLGVLEPETDSGPKGNLFNQFVDIISNIFQPILAPLSAAGMLKGVAAVLSFALGAEFAATSTYAVLNAMGDGLFLLLPIFIGYTAMNKFGGSPFVGMMIASSLVYTGFIDGSIAGQFAESGGLDFFGIPFSVPTAGYGSTVMPIIASTAFAAFIEKQLRKILPDVVKLFLVPFFVALITIPLTFLVIGPVMNVASDVLGSGLISIQTFSPIIYGAVLAVMLKTKNLKLKELSIPAFISGIFGVTEPAIYGITLPKKRPFWVSCVVGSITGAITMALGIQAYQMGGLGIFRYTGSISPDGDMKFAIYSMILDAAALFAGFGLAWLLGFEDDAPTAMSKDEAKNSFVGHKKKLDKTEVLAPLAGKVLPLSEAKDPAFAEGVMGRGVVIEPTVGEVVAPFDGTVMTLFPTNHALGLISNDGMELLIHIGIDTVQLEGKYFEALVKQGDTVKKGDVLIRFDIEAIENEGYSTQVPIIITNTPDYADIIATDALNVQQGALLTTAIVAN